ncbi:MAG: M28 family peptidase [Anaerolineae bacterium]|nr:M28 family peptidase [Anaerolineae bacterium]
MSKQAQPVELSAEQLMAHVQHLSVVIGPRHPTSRAEREAAAYIHDVIRQLDGEWELVNQPFRSVDGFRYRIAPLAALTGISLLFGLRGDRRSRLISGLMSIGLSMLSRDAFLTRPAVWESWLPRGESQNVIVRIPPRGESKRRLVFVAHMDSGVHRVTARPGIVQQLPRTLGGITLMGLVGGVLTALSGRNRHWRWLRALIGLSALGAAGLAAADEMGQDIQGANGNASGMAALLGLAAFLHRKPLDSTEIVLAFTGSATAVATGADALATTYGGDWKDALWVVVNNVGTGELCWVTRHGISPYAYYHPHPEAVAMMERVANARPDLGMMGKSMLTMDEIALLRDRSLRAVALMAYDRVTGLIPNWRQNSDTIHAITPGTVERAAHALLTAAQQVDRDTRAS